MNFLLLLCLISRAICAVIQQSESALLSRQARCTNPSIRREWRRMSDNDRLDYLRAERCLITRPGRVKGRNSQNRFEDLQAVHQMYTGLYHDNASFMPWHRYFLHVHETLLRNECGYRGPMPWWDETLDTGRFERAPLFNSRYFGILPTTTVGGPAPCVRDGVFANLQLHIGPGGISLNRNHCLSRAAANSASRIISQTYVNLCNSFNDYTRMQQCSTTGPHAYGHVALQGTMADVAASPGDPVFYLHHAFVDRNWRLWQNKDPGTRTTRIEGFTTTFRPADGWHRITMGYKLTSLGLLPDVSVGDVMNTMGGYLCYKYDY